LIEFWIYFWIAAGCNAAGWGFWRSLGWPVAAGRLLVKLMEDD